MKNLASNKPVVFYDGGCPLCSKEIAHYKKCTGASQLTWLDISREATTLEKFNLSYDAAMQQFHVLSPQGQFHVGAYGFVYLWSFLRPYRLLSQLLTRLRLVKPLNWFYLKFADWRIRDKCNENCSL